MEDYIKELNKIIRNPVTFLLCENNEPIIDFLYNYGIYKHFNIIKEKWYNDHNLAITEIEHLNQRLRKTCKFNFSDIIFRVIIHPEADLHPKYQAKIADLITKLPKCKNAKFLIKTHSKVIINRIGHRINNNDCDNSKFEILIFENDEKIINCGYDKEGNSLSNWPFGFLSPDII